MWRLSSCLRNKLLGQSREMMSSLAVLRSALLDCNLLALNMAGAARGSLLFPTLLPRGALASTTLHRTFW